MRVTHEQAWRLLNKTDNILLLTHRSPDGDAVGSAFALYHILKDLGKNVRCVLDDIPKQMKFIVDEAAFLEFDEDYVVTVDVADNKLLMDSISTKYADKIFLCIDHHETNSPYAENTLLDEKASAASEVIFDMLAAVNQDYSLKTAEALYVGISTDTGCFRYSNTTASALSAASALVKKGVDNGKINRLIFETKTKEYAAFELLALNSLKTYFDGKCALIILTRYMFKKTGANDGDTHSINALPRQIEGVLVGIVIKELSDGTYRISVRSNEPVSAADICAKLGGGGHRLAAGCEMSGSITQVVNTILKIAGEAIAEVQ